MKFLTWCITFASIGGPVGIAMIDAGLPMDGRFWFKVVVLGCVGMAGRVANKLIDRAAEKGKDDL